MPQVGADRGERHAGQFRDLLGLHPVVEQGGDNALLLRQPP
jgi:hypothetical protein